MTSRSLGHVVYSGRYGGNVFTTDVRERFIIRRVLRGGRRRARRPKPVATETSDRRRSDRNSPVQRGGTRAEFLKRPTPIEIENDRPNSACTFRHGRENGRKRRVSAGPDERETVGRIVSILQRLFSSFRFQLEIGLTRVPLKTHRRSETSPISETPIFVLFVPLAFRHFVLEN